MSYIYARLLTLSGHQGSRIMNIGAQQQMYRVWMALTLKIIMKVKLNTKQYPLIHAHTINTCRFDSKRKSTHSKEQYLKL